MKLIDTRLIKRREQGKNTRPSGLGLCVFALHKNRSRNNVMVSSKPVGLFQSFLLRIYLFFSDCWFSGRVRDDHQHLFFLAHVVVLSLTLVYDTRSHHWMVMWLCLQARHTFASVLLIQLQMIFESPFEKKDFFLLASTHTVPLTSFLTLPSFFISNTLPLSGSSLGN